MTENDPIPEPISQSIKTGGGAFLEGDIKVKEGDVTLRDKITNNNTYVFPSPEQLYKVMQDGVAIRQGLVSLSHLIDQLPGLARSISGVRRLLEQTRIQVRRINECKETHELLQKLESSHRALEPWLYDFGRIVDAERINWRNLRGQCIDVCEAVEHVRRYVVGTSFATGASGWLRQLDTGSNSVRIGLEQHNLVLLDAGVQDIYDVIGGRTTEMNSRLYEAVDGLHFPELITELRLVQTQIFEQQVTLDLQTHTEFKQFVAGLDSLERYQLNLFGLRDVHDNWQALDNELRREYAQLFQGISGLVSRWPRRIQPMLQAICQSEGTQTVRARLQTQSEKLMQTLQGKDLQEIDDALFDVRSTVFSRFCAVDFELLQVCTKLREAGGPLDIVLERLA